MNNIASEKLTRASTDAREFFCNLLKEFNFGEDNILEIIENEEYKETIQRAANATITLLVESGSIFPIRFENTTNAMRCSLLNTVKLLENLGIIEIKVDNLFKVNNQNYEQERRQEITQTAESTGITHIGGTRIAIGKTKGKQSSSKPSSRNKVLRKKA